MSKKSQNFYAANKVTAKLWGRKRHQPYQGEDDLSAEERGKKGFADEELSKIRSKKGSKRRGKGFRWIQGKVAILFTGGGKVSTFLEKERDYSVYFFKKENFQTVGESRRIWAY